MSAKDMLKVVRDEAQRLAEISPQIPDPIIEEFKKKFGEYYSGKLRNLKLRMVLILFYVYPSDLRFSNVRRNEV